MPKKKTKTGGAAAEERESEAIDREMDDAAGPLDDADDAEGSDGEETKAAPETTSEEEQLAARVLGTLRASDKPLTVAALHAEIGEDGPNGGQEGYVASGQVEKALGILLARGLAEREGEAWQPVRPGVLARRRAELLQTFVELSFSEAEWADADRAVSAGVDEDPTKHADAKALVTAGLLTPPEGDDDFYSAGERAKEATFRGALALVEETMAECREAHAAVITDGDPAAELAKERTSRQGFEAMYEGAVKERSVAQQAAERARADVEKLQAWFRENNLASPLDKPEVPKPPREEFTHSVTVDLSVKGRMYGIRKKLAQRIEDATGALEQAKADFKTVESAAKVKIKALDDAEAGFFYDVNVFRRVDLARGVAQLVAVEDESWVVQEVPLRSEQIAEEKAKAEQPAEVAPAEQPTDTNALRVVPADEHGQAAEGALPTGALSAAVASPAFAEKLAAATGQKVSVDTSGAVPVVTVGDKPKRDLILDKAHVEDALVEHASTFGPDDVATVGEATEALAKAYGIEASTALGQLVKAAARSAHKKSRLHWAAVEGGEIIGRVREKKPEANGAGNGAPTPAEADPTAGVLAKIREAGADGLRRIEFADDEQPAIDTLLERGAVKKNGKKGVGARVLAAEFAPTNGAGAKVSA